MAKQIRSKKTTIGNQVITMQSVMSHVEPTLNLSDLERSHFDRIVKSREISTWSPHDLSVACNLAQAMENSVQMQKLLAVEGLTVINERGTRIPHPLLHASMTVANTVLSISKTLGLAASQRGIAGEVQTKRNQTEQAARKVIERAATEDLI